MVRKILWLLAASLLAHVHVAEAQQPAKIPTIGYLSAGSPSSMAPFREAFQQGLDALGYLVTKNIIIEYRYADGKLERLPDLAAELVRLRVDVRETELAARAFGVQLQYLDVADPKNIATAFQEAINGRAEAVLVLQSGVLNSRRKQLVELAIKSRLPAIYYAPEWVEDGGLMTYTTNAAELWRRAATYVDKILKGTKPAELPVEQPTKFELAINLKTARQIGLTIPPNVLARADRVIK
jgi:ABC-type uncharacterized transport system substrate-binding protein